MSTSLIKSHANGAFNPDDLFIPAYSIEHDLRSPSREQ